MMRRALELSLLLFSAIVCYNAITMLMQNQKASPRKSWTPSPWHHLNRQNRVLTDPVMARPGRMKKSNKEIRRFHVAMTGEDTPYSKWQSRIMYYWYMKKKKEAGGGSEMGEFTRILHSGKPDNLMDEIPTFVVDPLPEGYDRGYVVLNRPWAFVQWLEKTTIEEEYVLMAEPDHILLKPLQNLAYEEYPVAFSFFYIQPLKHEKLLRKFFPENMGPITNIDPIGNSPVIIKKDLLQKIAPTWMNLSLEIKYDNETDKTLGWVQEMYAYAIASALHGVRHILRKDFMLQPPWDIETGNKFILHYTYALDYTMEGVNTYGKIGEWRFDKRSYLDFPPPRNLSLPPPTVPQSVMTLIKLINEATANIPNWDSIGEVQ